MFSRKIAFLIVPAASLGLGLQHTPDARSASSHIVAVLQRTDTLVKAASVPRYRAVATVVSEVQIGGASATTDEYIFSLVRGVRPLRDGSIVVIDLGSGTSVFVRVYSAEGRYLRTLGRYGDGPGEYRAPEEISELPDGRILVRDGRGERIGVYNSSGSGTGTQFFSLNTGTTTQGNPAALTASPGGTVHLRIASTGTRAAFIRLRPDGSLIDTLSAPQFPDIATPGVSVSQGRSIPLPQSPVMFAELSPLGYFVTGRTDRYAIDLRIPLARSAAANAPPPTWKEGDPVVSIRRNTQPVSLNEDERADARRRIEQRARAVNPTWFWTGPDVPRVKLPIKDISFGLDGRIWVLLSTPSERFTPPSNPAPGGGATRSAGSGGGGGGGTGAAGGAPPAPVASVPTVAWREPALYDVFEPDGSYVGQVSVPFGTSIHARRGDQAWGTTRDADGTQTVHRFRITWR